MTRWTVRITDHFERDLDRQLPAERAHDGTPSRFDFLLYEMPAIVEAFASSFDELPHQVGAPANVRSLIGRGIHVHLYFVAGRLNQDGVVELQTIEIIAHPPDGSSVS